MPFGSTSLNIAIPTIGADLNCSPSALSWIVTSYILITLIFAIPFGKLADNFGKRRVLLTGIFVFCVMHFLAGFIPQTLPQLVVFRMGQGLGTAFMFATNLAILADAFPPGARGKALGLANTVTFFGLSAGPVVGGLITNYLGWRAVFHTGGAIALFAFIIAILHLKEKAPETREGYETDARSYAGSVSLFMLSALFIFAGLSTLTQYSFSYILLAVGIVLFVVYIRREAKVKTPILKVSLFRNNPNFLLFNLASVFISGAAYVMGYMLAIYLQLVGGYTADFSGLILIIQPILQAVISPFAGKLSDRVSSFKVASVGMVFCVVSLTLFSFLGVSTPLPYVLLCLILAGIGIGIFITPNSNAILSCVQAQDYSVTSSILNTMRNVGHITGITTITIILSYHFGATPIAEVSKEGLVSSMTTCFLIYIFVCLVGVFFAFGRKNTG